MTKSNETITAADIGVLTVGTKKPSFADNLRAAKQEAYAKEQAEGKAETKKPENKPTETTVRVFLGDVIYVKPGTGDKSDYIFLSAFAEDGVRLAKQTMIQVHVGQGMIQSQDIAYGAKLAIAGKKLEMTELTYDRKDRNGKVIETLPIFVLRGIEDASLLVVEHRKENVQLEKTDALREGGVFAQATAAVKSFFWKGK